MKECKPQKLVRQREVQKTHTMDGDSSQVGEAFKVIVVTGGTNDFSVHPMALIIPCRTT